MPIQTDMVHLAALRQRRFGGIGASSVTNLVDPWHIREHHDASTRAREAREARLPLVVRRLGWSAEQAADTYYRLRPFADEWDAPGMDAYDAL